MLRLNEETFYYAWYLIELSLVDYKMLKFKPSEVAASACLIAWKMMRNWMMEDFEEKMGYSEEVNQNLCATKTARMYTQPMLEIYADDVKCSHGSTVGQLNDAALFYMRQRGISEKEAKLLLEFAFINEVVDKIQLEPLRDRLHYLVEKRFRGELSKCEGCKMCK